MRPEHCNAMQVVEVQGVLLGTLDQWDADDVLKRWQISTGQECIDVTMSSTDLSHGFVSEPLRPYRFQIVRWGDPDDMTAPLMVIGANRIPYDYSISYLPAGVCPIVGVHGRAKDLIEGIATEPLRRFVHAALDDRFVSSHFWSMPASMRHHHACSGGLAQHSVEVAEDMASQGQLTTTERDLGVAGALLHDIGKVWSYTRDMFMSEEGLAMGHELTGLSRLDPHLQELEQRWKHGAFAMRVLLSGCGRMRTDGSMPSALLARIRACDQRSCERNTGSPVRPSRSWIPAPYEAPF